MIKMSSNGIVVMFKGRLETIPTKRGLNVITTNIGAEKSESLRGVVNLSARIEYITEENYENLTTMFLTSNNKIDIEDMNRGRYFPNYYITGESIQLEEKEDIENNAYYYVGGIQLNKR